MESAGNRHALATTRIRSLGLLNVIELSSSKRDSRTDRPDASFRTLKVNSQPYRMEIWQRPLHSVPLVGTNQQRVAHRQSNRILHAFDQQARPAIQDDHPFIVILIIPEPIRRSMTKGNNPLDTDIPRRSQQLGHLIGMGLGKILKGTIVDKKSKPAYGLSRKFHSGLPSESGTCGALPRW